MVISIGNGSLKDTNSIGSLILSFSVSECELQISVAYATKIPNLSNVLRWLRWTKTPVSTAWNETPRDLLLVKYRVNDDGYHPPGLYRSEKQNLNSCYSDCPAF